MRQKSKVFFFDVAESDSKALVARLGNGAEFIKCDVTDIAAMRAALAEVERKAGAVTSW